jgi:hypothetical protein
MPHIFLETKEIGQGQTMKKENGSIPIIPFVLHFGPLDYLTSSLKAPSMKG